MGETIAQTRVEIAAQRAEIEAIVAQIREALDVRQRVRDNPGLVIGLAAGTLFLLLGGPRRIARAASRKMAPGSGEAAFDALPAVLQAWVETLAQAAGPRAGELREALVEEVSAWRHHRVKDRKAREELARQLVEGPPGPSRTAWTALEAGLAILSAALARRAVERFLTAEGGPTPRAARAMPEETPPAVETPKTSYSGFSTRGPGSTSAP